MEEWRDVVGYVGWYDVSSCGSVRRHKSQRILKPRKDRSGYCRVVLHTHGKAKNTYIHRLVAAAFIGPCMDYLEVNHKNGVSSDNSIANLEYVTHSQNVQHATHVLRVGPIKLTKEDVIKMRAMWDGGAQQKDIAEEFDCSRALTCMVINRVRWAHV